MRSLYNLILAELLDAQFQIFTRYNTDQICIMVITSNCCYHTVVLREAWATLPESSSRPLPATLAQSRNLAHASLKTAVRGLETFVYEAP